MTARGLVNEMTMGTREAKDEMEAVTKVEDVGSRCGGANEPFLIPSLPDSQPSQLANSQPSQPTDFQPPIYSSSLY
ncbi:hypothetical protein D8674_041643 [Pyrus ussuriensis x Pyrus communis]|uniref:Uncharacterized protein n=1 Tax=Pyrus ussuriensis x Pyrus communis TaxID=2448454 RepID=A0A5N5GB52_9ROSA|nr:hypothetical protein D8674_034962 [Pyrus ussuriensis x Pyrus communis]KAB2623806.1 hypothetical protein D8674_041643 [Pyrus ussuriensis x Pyrus communis]